MTVTPRTYQEFCRCRCTSGSRFRSNDRGSRLLVHLHSSLADEKRDYFDKFDCNEPCSLFDAWYGAAVGVIKRVLVSLKGDLMFF